MGTTFFKFRVLNNCVALCAFTLSAFGFAQPPKEVPVDGITVIADTVLRDGKLGATVRVDLGKLSSRDFEVLSFRAPDGRELLPDPGEAIFPVVIVPSSLSSEDIQVFADVIKDRMERRFLSRQVEIRVVQVDVEAAENLVEISANQIDAAQAQLSTGSKEGLTLANSMKRANTELINQLKGWKKYFKEHLRAIQKDPEAKSMLYGTFIGMASSIGPAYFWFSTTGGNWYGAGQALTSIMFDQANTRYSTRLIDFEANHEVPVFKNSLPVRIYNASSYLKALAVNFGLTAGGTFVMRGLSWLHNPSNVASPFSLEFGAELMLGAPLLSSAANAATDIYGGRELRRKGYISTRTELIVNSVFNALTQMNMLLLGSGRTDLLVYGMAIEFVSKAVTAAAGRLLPSKGNHVVVVHPGIDQRDKKMVKYIAGVEDALMHEDVTLEKMRLMVTKAESTVDWIGNARKVSAKAIETTNFLTKKLTEAWRGTCNWLTYRFLK
jgi:hypothetical protein